jgi:CubicO group peptidase (beta-lactamase class C family)
LNAGKEYPNLPQSMYFFTGYQGQDVYVLPEQDLVVVRMGLTKNADVDLLLNGIVESIKK